MVENNRSTDIARVLALTHFCGVTPRVYEALLGRYGTVEAIFGADEGSLAGMDGLTEPVAEKLLKASEYLEPAARLVTELSERDIRLLIQSDPEMQTLQMELNDPPTLLYVRGDFPNRDQKTAAVMGTRNAGEAGIALTAELVKKLAASSVQVVSTLKGGIDSAAHLAARTAEGRSFAVLDCGVDHLENTAGVPVAIDVVQSGGVISEHHPDQPGGDATELAANRLVVGLSQAVIITEMYSDSKRTLDLAQACYDLGQMLFYVMDPDVGAQADETSLRKAVDCGAMIIEGLDKVDDIVRSLV